MRGDEPSAIRKSSREGPVVIGPLGLEEDEQADLRVHGGPDKAVHHYPFDHYPFWKAMVPDHPRLDAPGGFGENISTSGLAESDVCIGDRFALGSAVVEISQGRQPCWKQGHVMEWNQLVAHMVKHRRIGWYYRVIEPGEVRAGDRLDLIDRPLPQWDVRRVFGLLIGGEGKDELSAVEQLAELTVLAEEWRAKARRLLAA
ncbi:MOSC domain-containing protein [Parasphingopyxis marina]|uniref:MOSC domain-containing protein n=1 Tax=Parasphingopyxis marina TaxID=2761622 RepID=UPI002E2B45E7|nr:MOSC domain-containing protein [Parasphingopyxis marina]